MSTPNHRLSVPDVQPLVALLIVVIATSSLVRADSTTYFRKNNGVAVHDKQPLPDDFGRDQQVWRVPMETGISTPCVYGDLVVLTTFRKADNELSTVALDRKTGKLKWKKKVVVKKIEPYHQVGSPAACTPACDGKRLYVFFGSYGLLCYDLDGKLIWSKPMGPFQDEFGASSSPVLVDGKVILNEDHDTNSFIIALNAETGKTVWKISRPGRTRSYSTPIIWDAGSHKQVIVAGSLELAGYDVHDGRKVWWVDGLSRIVDTTPVMVDGTVYLATWTPGGDSVKRISMEPFADAAKKYDKDSDGKIAKGELPEGAVLTRFFRIDLDQDGKLGPVEWAKHARVFQQAQNVAIAVRSGGEGNVTKTHVKWIQRRGLPTVPSPLVYHGIVYMVKKEGIVTTLDTRTGTQLKQGRIPGRGNYYASIVAGDGKVYLASERGVVSVLDAGRQWEVRGSHDFGERIMATPTIADGRVYLRTDKALYCFSAE